MQIEQILDLQMDAHRYYSSEEGLKFLTYTLAAIGGPELLDFVQKLPDEDKLRVLGRFKETGEKLLEHLYRGDCCFVTKDILQIATKASEDLPDDVELDEMELLCPMGFMLFEKGITHLDVIGIPILIAGMAWGLDHSIIWGRKYRDEDDDKSYFLQDDDARPPTKGVHIWLLIDQETTVHHEKLPGSQIQVEHWYPYEFGEKLTWEERSGSIKSLIKLFIALQLLSRQDLIEVRSELASRPARKRSSHWRPHSGYLSVITLRHKKIQGGGDGQGKIEHEYRWLVGSHWRRQWYPKMQKHQWKYIYQYVKGPTDKPLVIRSRRVFNFRR